MTKKSGSSSSPSPMTSADAARIQSSVAQSNNGQVPAGSFAARAQSAAAHNSNGKAK